MTKKSVSKTVAPVVEKTPSTRGSAPSVFEPFSRTGLTDWFDHWPEMFASRWPETFRNMPFAGEVFRMEQFTEDDGTFVVRGELPGLNPDEDVTITLDDGRMTITGERQDKTEERDNGSFRSEFHYGKFERTVRLPVGARKDDIAATYDDGILEVRVPVDAETPDVTTVPIVHKG